MMDTQIHITCNQDSWGESLIQARGVPGIAFEYAYIRGNNLPNGRKEQFDQIVELFRGMGAQEWNASFVVCERRDDPESVVVSMEVDVGFGKREIEHVLADAASIALYDALVSAEFWLPILEQRYKKEEGNGNV